MRAVGVGGKRARAGAEGRVLVAMGVVGMLCREVTIKVMVRGGRGHRHRRVGGTAEMCLGSWQLGRLDAEGLCFSWVIPGSHQHT